MSEYTPDNWVMIKCEAVEGTYYKIIGGWSGGYTSGSSWRVNSGVVKAEETENFYHFQGSSGSVYICGKDSNVIRMNMSRIVALATNVEGCSVVEDVDYMKIDYNEGERL